MSEYDSSLRTGLIAINLPRTTSSSGSIQTTGEDDIVMVSRDGQTIRFSESDVRPMGRAGGRRAGHEAEGGGRRRELRRSGTAPSCCS